MNRKVLFVDDEEPLLAAFERNMGATFEMQTANCGPRALELMREQGPFAVVVTDMRMPKMTGLELIKLARKESPDTTFIMLTGNQDVGTAASAVNEGQVFRFLNKPCPGDELRRVVQEGWQQHQLVAAEKELLQNTFAGAVGVLTDVLGLVAPTKFRSAEQIERIVAQLAASLGHQQRWEFKLAARLGLIGYALVDLGQDEEEAGSSGNQLTADVVARAAAIGQRLLERIPRLSPVARIIGAQPNADGQIPPAATLNSEEVVTVGAVLVLAAILWDHAVNHRLAPAAALQEVRTLLPRLPDELCKTLLAMNLSPAVEEGAARPCPVGLLKEGMVLAANLTNDEGAILMSSGRRLTATMIEKIRDSAASGAASGSIMVYDHAS